MNFIKKIFKGEVDETVHFQFIRFGKGDYRGRFPLSLWKTKKVKLRTSFEFTNDIVLLCAKMGNCKVSGEVISKNNLSEFMSENNIKGETKSKRGGIIHHAILPSQDLTEEQLIKLVKVSNFALLDIVGADFTLKIKKKIPRAGKNENKIDDKFCQLDADEKHFSIIKNDFFWDVPDSKKIKIVHELIISEIIKPEGETDFSRIREFGKRKGKIIRKAVIDDVEKTTEKEFVA